MTRQQAQSEELQARLALFGPDHCVACGERATRHTATIQLHEGAIEAAQTLPLCEPHYQKLCSLTDVVGIPAEEYPAAPGTPADAAALIEAITNSLAAGYLHRNAAGTVLDTPAAVLQEMLSSGQVLVESPASASFDLVKRGERRGIRCRLCGVVSWNENDVRYRYCGTCDRFHEPQQEEKS